MDINTAYVESQKMQLMHPYRRVHVKKSFLLLPLNATVPCDISKKYEYQSDDSISMICAAFAAGYNRIFRASEKKFRNRYKKIYRIKRG